jgi:hypothetical protein
MFFQSIDVMKRSAHGAILTATIVNRIKDHLYMIFAAILEIVACMMMSTIFIRIWTVDYVDADSKINETFFLQKGLFGSLT